jgi:SAM-dependent methyltransferase
MASENYWFRRHEAAYHFALRWARGPVLDVGCGEGYGANMLSRSCRVVALELDADASTHASGKYPAVVVLRGDACRLPFRPRSFRTVIALQVVEHLWCPEGMVEQAREILAPGGAMVISTPNRDTFSPTGTVNPFHAHEYTAKELTSLLSRAFDRVEVFGVRRGIYLESLDVLAAGSLQHLLMTTPWEELPSRLRTGVGLVRADHFSLGQAEGSLDLFAVAS